MNKTAFYAIVPLAIGLVFCFSAVVHATYQEECLSEGCSGEEVSEMHHSYQEECLNEGCSQEEITELGGSGPGAQAMLMDFRRRGFQVRPQDQGISPACRGTTTSCFFFVLVCDDNCFYPDGTKAAPYACGGCGGFWW